MQQTDKKIRRKLELLAPAKDADHGMAAINQGADAVYIGAPKFGARSAVPNSMSDIERLAAYAHRFGAKVHMAINTVLYDDELAEAERIAHQAWNAGVDALIVQDMAFCEMNLPPIPLHASTQAFTISPEKARFFEQAGFSRVILERALGLDGIRRIRQATQGELEVFVHGAVCVCYSGQCYMSQAVAGRSGNRGECMQPCRWDYNLVDADLKKVVGGKHLLSVRDLNLSENIEELINAGVMSFKIEGRLKDMTYLRNSVGYYRRKLDEVIARRDDLCRSSQGTTLSDFTPDPEKSFTRGFTDYYLKNGQNKVASFDTPKAIGQYIGQVTRVAKDHFLLEGDVHLSNGDGICFVTSGGEPAGTNVNKAEGNRVWPNRMEGITPGVSVYRNYDRAFSRLLEHSKTRRVLDVAARVMVAPDRLTLRFTDDDGNEAERSAEGVFDPAQNPAHAHDTISRQVAKSGDTFFRVIRVDVDWDEPRFVPAAALNALRRETLELLSEKRSVSYVREQRKAVDPMATYPEKTLTYLANVTNRLAEEFYRKHGVEQIDPGFEVRDDYEGKAVMRTRYCIRREMGWCLKDKGCKYRGPLQLENNYHIFELAFDCGRCEMSLIYRGKRK